MNCQSSKGIAFVISAPSGAGKTSICRNIRHKIQDLFFSVSYTTREKRVGEKEGEDYFFISRDSFNKMVTEDKFLEWAEVHGHFYGTSKEYVSDKLEKGLDCLLDIDIKGANSVKVLYPDGVFIFVIPPSMQELKSRLSCRKTEDDAQISIRMKNALSEIRAFEEYSYIIINDDLKRASEELRGIVLAERCRTHRIKHKVIEILGG